MSNHGRSLGKNTKSILAWIEEQRGPVAAQDVAQALNLSASSVRITLYRLAKKKVITRTSWGRYQSVNARGIPREAEPPPDQEIVPEPTPPQPSQSLVGFYEKAIGVILRLMEKGFIPHEQWKVLRKTEPKPPSHVIESVVFRGVETDYLVKLSLKKSLQVSGELQGHWEIILLEIQRQGLPLFSSSEKHNIQFILQS